MSVVELILWLRTQTLMKIREISMMCTYQSWEACTGGVGGGGYLSLYGIHSRPLISITGFKGYDIDSVNEKTRYLAEEELHV